MVVTVQMHFGLAALANILLPAIRIWVLCTYFNFSHLEKASG